MEQKGKGIYFTRFFFSVIFVILMLVSTVYGVYRGADYFVKYRSEWYEEHNGYLQRDYEAEQEMLLAAENMLEATVDKAAGVKWGDNYKETTGIVRQVVVAKDSYFLHTGNNIEKYTGDSGIDEDAFFDDKQVAFCYDGQQAYLKYADGSVREYGTQHDLKNLDTDISKLITTYGYSDITVYVWADETIYYDLNPGLEFADTLLDYRLDYIIAALGISVIALVMASVVTVRTKRGSMRKNQIFTEIPVIVTLIDIFMGFIMADYLWECFDEYTKNIKIAVTAAAAVLMLILYFCIRECVLKIKEKRFFKDSLIVKMVKWVLRKCRETFWFILDKSHYKDFDVTKKLWIRKIFFMIFTILYVPFACLFIAEAGAEYYYNGSYSLRFSPLAVGFVIVIYLIVFLMFTLFEMRALKRMNDVYQQIDDIYEGEYAIRDVEEGDLLYDITEKLNGLSNGMEEAVEKRISSEKMKVELITNVSHDLKTPLTSIISYVDLLKEEEMSDTAQAYVKILEDKSYQLKNIVSDVFDLAKANSGQDVEIETIDGIMLIHQVLADMNDAIEKSGKVVRADIQPDTFFIKGDGKKLYRALQNLIDNALKYSMNGTRIYITSGVAEEKLKLVIKNIASYEMDFSGEDIVERFARGDESRTTEGNGLGLSIAKSFIEVSGGSMRVDVDGDVFRVTVEF